MNDKIKIILISVNSLDNYIQQLLNDNENLILAKKFTTNKEEFENEEYSTYLDLKTLNIAYKNNSFLYVSTNDNITHGITMDEYYSSNIMDMNINEFNLISDYLLNEDILVCWIDKSKVYDFSKLDLNEIRILENRLEHVKYLYFLNCDESEFSSIINKYLIVTDEEKNKMHEEYS